MSTENSTDNGASEHSPATLLPYYLSKMLKELNIHDAASLQELMKGVDLEKYRDASGKITCPISKEDRERMIAGYTAEHHDKMMDHHDNIPQEHHDDAVAHLSKIAEGLKS